MELKQVKELIATMEKAGLKKLSIKEKDGFELQLEMQEEHPAHHQVYAPSFPAHPSHPPLFRESDHFSRHEGGKDSTKEAGPEKKPEGKYVASPMVGTFYSSPSPEDPAFVKVGDKVDENTVVCIIEAMKVMNEVKAGMSGVVAEVCIDSGHPVEFGTKIFRIV
ncbi:MAG: acetyl-CoA carboxylase biotin carboxyl carrier protein [Chlamydiae bacterium]|nr:acetyl-CoA carboxylase biotin carboxyl carrier protein [Chlamydiota bacterium]